MSSDIFETPSSFVIRWHCRPLTRRKQEPAIDWVARKRPLKHMRQRDVAVRLKRVLRDLLMLKSKSKYI